jgi:hypothetical protein
VSQLFLLPQKAPANLLSRTQLFLLCIRAIVARGALRVPSVRLASPQCSAAPNNLNASLRLVLGDCVKIYNGGALCKTYGFIRVKS